MKGDSINQHRPERAASGRARDDDESARAGAWVRVVLGLPAIGASHLMNEENPGTRPAPSPHRTSCRSFGPVNAESAYDADMASVADPHTVLAELESADRLLVQQVFKPIANEYRISMPSPGSGEEGRSLLYVKQKKMKIKEDIRFRVSPDDEAHLFMIKSKSVFEYRGRHEVLDADGAVIGLLEKDFTRSLLRSHWHVRDASGTELLEAHERSWIIALVRRFAELGPDLFSLLTWLPFNFVLRRGEQEMGTYKRVLGKFRDRYVLELAPELRNVDRRLIVAFAVGLDALQDR